MPKGRKNRGRRAPARRDHNPKQQIDANAQDSRLRQPGSDTLTWSLTSGAYPRFGRVTRFDNSTFNVIQMAAPVTLFTTSNTLATFGVYTFTATNTVAQFNSWSNVFDQYRIMEIEVWITANLLSSSTIAYGAQNLYSVIDYDDGVALTTIAQVLSYENVIATSLTNGHYRKWRPHIAAAAYSGVFTSCKNDVSAWIDVASPAVQHYGIKCAADVTAAAIDIKMFTRVWIQFRNVY
jgi:hypothetical protein